MTVNRDFSQALSNVSFPCLINALVIAVIR